MPNPFAQALARCSHLAVSCVAAVMLAACGGGDDGDLRPVASGFPSSLELAAQCVAPRPASATDPFSGRAYNDRPGSAATEKAWVRSFTDETYLWYDEVPDLDPAAYATARDYFEVLKTPLGTPSGKPKDAVHFSRDTNEYNASAIAGEEIGYGMALLVTAGDRYLVGYTEPGSSARANSLARGAELLAIDGVLIASVPPATLDRALFPPLGESHTFTVRDRGASASRNVTLMAGVVTRAAVQNTSVLQTGTGDVGYFLFNDHDALAEAELVAAVDALNATAPISDLVVDMRYNGGGFLDIASELAFMVAGGARTNGRIFERLLFNNKNPYGDVPPTPFHATTQNYTLAAGQPLPQLGLSRVFVLTGGGTCSASESVINGLRGIGVQVVQIGTTTCGKPYGFFPEDNCSTTYFTTQFQGVNALGFGDYADGFVPACVVADDFTRELGDPLEARLSAALTVRATGRCPAASNRDAPQALDASRSARLLRGLRGPLRENRFVRR